MPCISGKFDPQLGILVLAGVLPPGSLQQRRANLQIRSWPALIDTGASHTCISQAIVNDLGLAPVGMAEVSGVHGAQSVPRFLIDLAINFGAAVFGMPNLSVTQFEIDGAAPFQILIGRDVLCMGALTISHDGHYTFCL
ncbi:MAG: aspartyl protease family protein [Nevskia sp.]|nr:aspartyl protease family protein [Nevskia sp.]